MTQDTGSTSGVEDHAILGHQLGLLSAQVTKRGSDKSGSGLGGRQPRSQ